MTALEELIEEVYERIRNFKSKELSQKYSVTLRNTSESTDNNSDELGLQIKAILHAVLGQRLDVFDRHLISKASQEIEKCVKTYRIMSNSSYNNSDDKSITDEELVSKIESMIDVFNIESKRDVKNPISCYIIAKERVAEKLLKLFKTCRVMSNSSVITQTEQSIDQEKMIDHKLLERLFDEILENISGDDFFKWLEDYKMQKYNPKKPPTPPKTRQVNESYAPKPPNNYYE